MRICAARPRSEGGECEPDLVVQASAKAPYHLNITEGGGGGGACVLPGYCRFRLGCLLFFLAPPRHTHTLFFFVVNI